MIGLGIELIAGKIRSRLRRKSRLESNNEAIPDFYLVKLTEGKAPFQKLCICTSLTLLYATASCSKNSLRKLLEAQGLRANNWADFYEHFFVETVAFVVFLVMGNHVKQVLIHRKRTASECCRMFEDDEDQWSYQETLSGIVSCTQEWLDKFATISVPRNFVAERMASYLQEEGECLVGTLNSLQARIHESWKPSLPPGIPLELSPPGVLVTIGTTTVLALVPEIIDSHKKSYDEMIQERADKA